MFGEIDFNIIQSLGLLFFDLGTEVEIKKNKIQNIHLTFNKNGM